MKEAKAQIQEAVLSGEYLKSNPEECNLLYHKSLGMIFGIDQAINIIENRSQDSDTSDSRE
jgi:hypothetical protein